MKRAPLRHGGVFSDPMFAARYARKHRKMGERLGLDFAKVLIRSGFRQGRILDAGCGPGATVTTLARALPEAEVVGVYLSDPLLDLARAARAPNGARVRFECADVQDLPFDDDAFDAVINANTVHLVPDPVAMLNEIERVLKPEGHLLVTDLRRSWLGYLEAEIRSAPATTCSSPDRLERASRGSRARSVTPPAGRASAFVTSA